MSSRHTTVAITSAEIKTISSALEQARDVMCEWQKLHKENVVDWRDTFNLPAEERYAALVKQWDQWDAPEGQMRAIVGVLDALDAVKAMEKQLWKQHSRKQPGEKIMAVEKSEKRQPTVAELRDLGKKEPEWVQEASAFKRSGDLGEFSGERRAQMEKVQAPAKEHAKPEAARELDRSDEYEMGS